MLALKNTAGTLPDFGLNEEVPTWRGSKVFENHQAKQTGTLPTNTSNGQKGIFAKSQLQITPVLPYHPSLMIHCHTWPKGVDKLRWYNIGILYSQ